MRSLTDRIYGPGDPSRWVGDDPPAHVQIGREVPVTAADQFLVNGFRVPRSLDPEIVPDPWRAQRPRLSRLFRLLGPLVLAGSAGAVVTLVMVDKLSIPGTIGAAEPAMPVIARASTPSQPLPAPVVAAQAPVERTPTPNIVALAPTKPTPGSNIANLVPAKTMPAATTLDPESEEAATLVKRGEQLAAAGDMASARLTLRRAAEAHNARAALALGATYDPNVLRSLGIYGVAPDIAEARSWYEKAKEYGSPEAPQRLQMLVRGRQ
jgi:hypothetical protein